MGLKPRCDTNVRSAVACLGYSTNPDCFQIYFWFVIVFFKKNRPIPASFYFRPFLITISIIQIEKSKDGEHGIQTNGRRMVGPDETTELWSGLHRIDIILKPVENSLKESLEECDYN